MTQRVAVVGNRVGWTYKKVASVLDELLEPSDVIVTGGAEGVDTFAGWYAVQNNHQLLVITPDESLPSPQRYYDRNEKIAVMCDYVIAFDKPGRSGTSNTLRYAKQYGKARIIFMNETEDEDDE